jgi:serine/threonine protein kinase
MLALHYCDDIEDALNISTSNPADTHCSSVLAENYTVAKVLGTGSYGLVLKARHRTIGGMAIAIKIMAHLESSVREMKLTCRVDREIASRGNALFSRTFGWIVCATPLPSAWREVIEQYDEQVHFDDETVSNLGLLLEDTVEPLFFVISQLGGQDLNRYRFTSVQECKGFLFELFYGLWKAYEATGFKHNDLGEHLGNVLIVENVNMRREYDGGFVVDQEISPRLIDFGHATFNNTDGHPLTDVIAFLELLSDDVSNYNPEIAAYVNRILQFHEAGELNTFEELIELPHFSSLRRPNKRRRTRRAQLGCCVCAHPATQYYEHAPSYGFCDLPQCHLAMAPLGGVIPFE